MVNLNRRGDSVFQILKTNSKINYYILMFVLFLSVIFNILLDKVKGYESRLGGEYLLATRNIIHELNGDYVNSWVDILKQEEGALSLERHAGEINRRIAVFSKMSGVVGSIIGMQLDFITRDLNQMKEKLDQGKNIESDRIQLEKRISFLVGVLSKIESDFGDDSHKWYSELSEDSSETNLWVLAEYKQFEKEFNLK